jgi:cysteine synthase A
MACALRLGKEEGIFVGISAGGTLSASLKIAAQAEKGSVIVTMLADTAERYLSTPLFANINEGSDDDWLAAQ